MEKVSNSHQGGAQADADSDVAVGGGLNTGTAEPPDAAVLLPEPRVSACKREFVSRPLGGHLGLRQPALLSHRDTESLPTFTARCFVGFSSWCWCSWQGSLVWGLAPSFFRGASAAELSLLVLNRHTWVWGQPFSCLCLSYHSLRGFFFTSLVMGSVQPVSRWFSRLVVL